MKYIAITLMTLLLFSLPACQDHAVNSIDKNTFVTSDSTSSRKSEDSAKYTPVSMELFQEIYHMDSLIFEAFNTQQFDKFKSMFTKDLEWFQDNDGIVPYKKVFENFGNTFKQEHKLSRQLIPGSLEVYPIKDYGAIEIGSHKFRHIENGKEETGIFKFLMIWQKKDGDWKIARVVSYSH